MFDEFKARAEAVSAEVFRFPSLAAAIEHIITLLRAAGVDDKPGSYAVWAGCPLLDGMDTAALAGRLPGLRFDVTRELAAQARAGVSQMDWGAAATGTLLQDATQIDQRLVSSLPLLHIAIVPSARIVADVPTALAKFDPRRCGYVAAITGPSRTADIERVLTIGVHGPERLVIVFVDECGA